MSKDEMCIVMVKGRIDCGCQCPFATGDQLEAGPARVRLEAVACQSKIYVSLTPATSKTQLWVSIAFILHNQPRRNSLEFKRNHRLSFCVFIPFSQSAQPWLGRGLTLICYSRTTLYEVFSTKYTLKMLNHTATKMKSSEQIKAQSNKAGGWRQVIRECE